MNEKPILFSTEMVRAILEGRKTQTRRIIKGPGEINRNDYNNHWPFVRTEEGYEEKPCPYGEVGNLLWVRETFIKSEYATDLYYYKTDKGVSGKWKPSIHMPKSAARIWLEITNVRCERLNEISEQDAISEGIEQTEDKAFGKVWANYGKLYKDALFYYNPIHSFASLWENINGEVSWRLNPWVWVIEFKLISKTSKPCKH